MADDDAKGWFLRPGVLSPPKPTRREATAQHLKAMKGKAGQALASSREKIASAKSGTSARLRATTDRFTEDLRLRLANCSSAARTQSTAITAWFNVALGDRAFASGLDAWLRDTYAAGPASIYDRAMDANYIATHIGGGFHRLFDGGHSLAGSWQACRGVGGESLAADVQGYFAALWKDLATPMGLPVATVDKASFDALAASLSDFGISRMWLADAISITATELVGDVCAVLAAALNWRAEDRQRFAGLVGSLGVSSMASANPLLVIITLVCLARAYQHATTPEHRLSAVAAALGGGVGSSAMLAALAILNGPTWVCLMVGICASVLARRATIGAVHAAAEVDWGDTVAFILGFLRLRLAPA